jgi:hypothetical protein
VFRAKKEVYNWLESGQKTIDVRKGNSFKGQVAVYLSGRKVLRMWIVKRETGRLEVIVRSNNFWLVIPLAATVEDAIDYLHQLYEGYDGTFTAYYVAPFSGGRAGCG